MNILGCARVPYLMILIDLFSLLIAIYSSLKTIGFLSPSFVESFLLSFSVSFVLVVSLVARLSAFSTGGWLISDERVVVTALPVFAKPGESTPLLYELLLSRLFLPERCLLYDWPVILFEFKEVPASLPSLGRKGESLVLSTTDFFLLGLSEP